MTEIRSETPTLTDLINESIDAKLYETNTSMPGIVVSYNSATNMADIQPAFTRRYITNPIPLPLPVIPNVPVALPRANQAFISFPIKPGDGVLLIFSQRSLDLWKAQGGSIPLPPADSRKHNISDAVAILGLYSATRPLAIDASNLVIGYGGARIALSLSGETTIQAGAGKISIDPSGKFAIGNGVVSLLDLIDELIDELMAATWATNTGSTSAPPINQGKFIALKQKLATIKG